MGSAERLSSVVAGRRLLVATIVLGGAGLVYAFGFSKSDMIYARTVDEVFTHPEKFSDERTVRLNGVLVAGSLVRLESCEHRFRLKDNGKEITVRFLREAHGNDCPPLPDTFCEWPGEERMISVEGHVESKAPRPTIVAERVTARFYRIPEPEDWPRCLPVPLAR